MTRLLLSSGSAATMRPLASSGKIGSSSSTPTSTSIAVAASRLRQQHRPSIQSLPLPLRSPSRNQFVIRASSDDSGDLESALARIERLEAENRKLREMLGGRPGDQEERTTETSSSSSPSSPPPPPATETKPAAAPPTSLQFQEAEVVEVAASSSSASSSSSFSTSSSTFDVSDVVWPHPGERFWERRPNKASNRATTTATTTKKNATAPPSNSNSDDIIVHVAAELAPRAKVGGLGDVVAGLARECASRGRRAVVVLPFYECLPEDAVESLELVDEFSCPKGKSTDGKITSVEELGVRAFSGRLDGIEVLLLRPDWDRTNLFRGGRIYGGSYNEAEAYLFFCRASLEALSRLVGRGFYPRPSILHVHDWQACAAAMLYWHLYAKPGSGSALAEASSSSSSSSLASVVLTIHNFDSSGECRQDEFAATGVDGSAFATIDRALDERTIGHNPERLCLLKGGLVYSNAVTTVSPSYAAEALRGGAAGWLRGTLARPDVAAKFSGVLNGIDEDLWDPASDPSLPVNYDAGSFREGKRVCKEFVQRGLGLDVDPSTPLVICVTRLVPQKGVHLIRRALVHTCRDLGGQFVLLGTGHADGEFKGLLSGEGEGGEFGPASTRARIMLLYSEDLSHQLYGAADAVIVPSLFEPCGLTQLVGLKYGAVPIVRSTGGLADTIFDADRDQDRAQQAGREVNGFAFGDASEGAVDDALDRALRWYRNENGDGAGPSERFLRLVESGMRQDWSWTSAADAYLSLYDAVKEKR